ncbi:YdcF family protein [Oribacterium sinus]|uniref:YdcF family protein n=1 Tax=Oribacterium sinus TaxID=237576 RepID=UPI0028D013D4|nr:ElyC/SanA/YdcF family protein [Oribacterium sinus]
MGIVFIILALGCFLYFGFLWTTASYLSFLWIWLLLGALHLLMAFIYKAPERLRKKPLFFRFRIFCLSSYCIFFLLFTYLIGYLSQYRYGQWKDPLSYILVVGSELENNKITPLLQNRLERADLCYQENPSATIVLSGGRGRNSASAEASVMYQSMLKMGIPADAMLMEFYSKTTDQKLSYGIESIFQGEQDQEGSEVQEDLRQKRREEVRKRLAAQENQVVDYEEDLDSDEIFDLEEEDHTETSEGLESREDSVDKEIRIGIVGSQYLIYRACHFAEQALQKQREEGKVEASQKVSIVGFPSVEDPALRPHLYFREALFLFGERLCHKL